MLNSTIIEGVTDGDHKCVKDIEGVTDEASWMAFCFSVVLSSIAGLISIVGNGLVLYVSTKERFTGRFKYVNYGVRNLALSDFLFGLIGTPGSITYWYWGNENYFYLHIISFQLYLLILH